MFELNNRKTLLELVAPPPGYIFERGIVTTYSLDLYAVMGILLALQNYDPEASNESGPDIIRSLTHIINKGNLIILCNKGQISCGRSLKLMRLLDNIVCNIHLGDGSFHPKVWILKYKPSVNIRGHSKDVYKFICTSKNLTNSGYLEISYAVEGERARPKKDCANLGLRAFLKDALSHASQEKFKIPEYKNFIEELCSVRFKDIPFDFHYQFGLKKRIRLINALDMNESKKIIVVSPFVDKGFLQTISEKNKEVTLISTRNALDALDKSDLIHFKKIFVSADDVEAEDIRMEKSTKKVALHAKIYILENHNKCDVWLGSANATQRGWQGKNAESVVRVSIPYSIEKFEEEFIYKDKSKNKLQGHLLPYDFPQRKKKDKEKLLNNLVSAITAYDFRIDYKKSNRIATLYVDKHGALQRYLSEYAAKNKIKVKISIGLYGLSNEHDLRELFRKGKMVFGVVGISEISEFLEFKVSMGSLSPKRIIILARSNLYGCKDLRIETTLKNAFSSPQQINDYIRYILMEDRAAFYDTFRYKYKTGNGSSSRKSEDRVLNLCMEDVLLKYDDEKVNEIDALLKKVNKQKTDKRLICFWKKFQKAIREKR